MNPEAAAAVPVILFRIAKTGAHSQRQNWWLAGWRCQLVCRKMLPTNGLNSPWSVPSICYHQTSLHCLYPTPHPSAESKNCNCTFSAFTTEKFAFNEFKRSWAPGVSLEVRPFPASVCRQESKSAEECDRLAGIKWIWMWSNETVP